MITVTITHACKLLIPHACVSEPVLHLGHAIYIWSERRNALQVNELETHERNTQRAAHVIERKGVKQGGLTGGTRRTGRGLRGCRAPAQLGSARDPCYGNT